MTGTRVVEASAIPHPGDFITVRVDATPYLVTHDANGQVHVLVNTCTHQAATVCRATSGNADSFECPNHFWVYRNDGTFVGSRLALATGREAPADPSKNLASVPFTVADGWIVAHTD
ncbi:Rieske 2Fe-2S domain-containing protein [Kocuria sp. JC486]|uniref:Rieske domain-containing protein n=1 Tax=Kocuria soli TaxID=2485125 RepID=A0A3N3ZTQ2_9MICC|nr:MULTISPECIES: Rieske 2Fe-2S domain-containing protein [Kocuria]NHU86159.1 Rieske 2Fe-2S domain-containing protein [Kocuria sp. JC486]ROZ65708.1 hypothetical protein EDL96_01085 [Kocuria soli]